MRRTVLALALTTLAVAPLAPAHARVCPMLSSPVNYQIVLGNPIPFPGAAVDIRSGDVASGDTSVIAVLRLSDLDDLPTLMTSVRWTFGWTVNGTPYRAEMDLAPAGTPIGTFTGPGGTTTVHTAASRATDDIVWRIPRGLLPDLAVPKRTFRDVHAVTQVFGVTADSATTPATYIDRTPGCIPGA